jgi:hypothetical protein
MAGQQSLSRTLTGAASVRFRHNETAFICEMSAKMLHNWVGEGRVVPAEPGSRGRYSGHRYSPQQLLGLAIVAAFVRSKRGCSADYVKEVLDTFTDMPDSALEHWLSTRRDAYTEEARAKWDKSPLFDPPPKTMTDFSIPPKEVPFVQVWTPSDEELLCDMICRVERVKEAILKRLGIEPPRGITNGFAGMDVAMERKAGKPVL